MATKKPRVTVTLEPDDYERLRALSEMNGESLSSLISGLVASVAPVLERVVVAGRQFEQLQESVRGDVRKRLEDAEATIGPEVERLQESFLEALAHVEHAAESAPDPRPVTRGSRTPTPPTSPSPESAEV